MLSSGGKSFLSITPQAEAIKEKRVRFVHKEIKGFCKSINTVIKTEKKMLNGKLYVT